jgi:hypothetical protein
VRQLSFDVQLSCTFALPFTDTLTLTLAEAATSAAVAAQAIDFAPSVDELFTTAEPLAAMLATAFWMMGPSVRAAMTSFGKFVSMAALSAGIFAEAVTLATSVTFGCVQCALACALLLQLTWHVASA